MMDTSSSKRDRADSALADIVRLFESGDLPAAVARSTITRMESDAPSQQWSLANRLLCLLAGTDDARGYRQWQAADRQVVKGSKSFAILAPRTRKITETNQAGEEQERIGRSAELLKPQFIRIHEGEPVWLPLSVVDTSLSGSVGSRLVRGITDADARRCARAHRTRPGEAGGSVAQA